MKADSAMKLKYGAMVTTDTGLRATVRQENLNEAKVHKNIHGVEYVFVQIQPVVYGHKEVWPSNRINQ